MHFGEPWVVSNGVQIGVALYPCLSFARGIRHKAQQQIDCLLMLARQRKTGRPVRFELTDVTRQAVDDYLRIYDHKPGQCLFPGRREPDGHLTTRQYLGVEIDDALDIAEKIEV